FLPSEPASTAHAPIPSTASSFAEVNRAAETPTPTATATTVAASSSTTVAPTAPTPTISTSVATPSAPIVSAAPVRTVSADAGARCPVAPPAQTTTITVREGDTLSAIAAECYGQAAAWRAVAQCNAFLEKRNVSNVSPLHGGDLLYAGDQLTLPVGGLCPASAVR